MIVGVINGYYRSGTTFMQRLCCKSNSNLIVLSEPTQHEIIDHIMANGCNSTNLLHGWEIFKDYCRLPRDVKHAFMKRHFDVFDHDKKQWGVMTSAGAVRHLLQPLHDCEQQVVIKSTQLHLFLDDIKEWYGCWVLHLDRSVENIVADHFTYYALTKSNEAKKLLLSDKESLPFYADLVFENLTRGLGVDKSIARHNLDKLVFNILATKKAVSEQKGVVVVDFDDFVANPHQHLDKLPFKVNESLLRLIDPHKSNPKPKWLIDAVNDSIKHIKDITGW